ncbi:PREDICTED: tumor necrosis factor receptor superfamily member 1A-like [Crocodylus porosus]|uniref:Tumor necrosis factor receptor superfamily member 6 n=1 Tax=Crocodylus porosus TaxID=8502 RepID=A0A7M4FJ87_CROPO|nr:PREDICTED: tumor necrosis factor receptor superfamily member 1A-like [Crocodylus porosus]
MPAAVRVLWLLLVLREVESLVSSRESNICGKGEYFHQDRCCKYCPAGTHVLKHCGVQHEERFCSSCTKGKEYTAHENDLEECLQCKQCKEDEETVRTCTLTSDTECQCKPGYFCPTQHCEMCYKCKTKCPEGKEIVQKCNATMDTVCGSLSEGSTTIVVVVTVLPCICLLVAVGIIFILICKKKPNKTNTEENDEEREVESEGSTEVLILPDMENGLTSALPLETETSAQSPQDQAANSPISGLKAKLPEDNGVASCESHKLLLNVTNHTSEEAPQGTEAPVKLLYNHNAFYPQESNMQKVQEWKARPQIKVKDLFHISTTEWSDIYYCFIKQVPARNWKELIRCCLKDTEIDNIIHEFPKDVKEQHYQMLIYCQNSLGIESTITKLLDRLWSMQLKSCYENIVNTLKSRDIITILDAKD